MSGKLNGVGQGECAACASPATHFVNIERGHAIEAINVCARHESISRQGDQGLRRFLSHVKTKHRFLEDPDAMKAEVRARREREGYGD